MYLGIDPGVSGAFAVIDEHEHVLIENFTNFKHIHTVLCRMPIKLAYLEKVHIMPGSSSQGSQTFMMNFGSWISLLDILSIPYILKAPTIWQNTICGATEKVSTKGITDTKEKARLKREHKKKIKAKSVEFANRYWKNLDLKPSEDGKADAINMALYAMKYHKSQI